MGVNVVGHGLELLEQLLRLVDDALVAQYRAVVRDVDCGGFVGVLLLQPLRFRVAFSESLESGDGFYRTQSRWLSNKSDMPKSTDLFRGLMLSICG